MPHDETSPRARFAQLLKDSTPEHLTAHDLARLIGGETTADQVKNWRTGRSMPWELLPRIATVLDLHDPLDEDASPMAVLLHRIGMLERGDESSASRLAYSIQKMELREQDLREQSALLGRSAALTRILRTAEEDERRWAVAFWPAYAGPEGFEIHNADRVDIRPADGEPFSPDELQAVPAWVRTLRAVHAVSRDGLLGWPSAENTPVSSWSIAHVGGVRAPMRQEPHLRMASVNCYSLTIRSRVNDIAGLLARSIGYGLTTTRDLAMDTARKLSGTTSRERAREHRWLLDNPPRRRVWAHHAEPTIETPNPFASQRTVPSIWLRESKRVLTDYSTRAGMLRPSTVPRLSVGELLAERERIDDLAVGAGALTIDIDYDRKDPRAGWEVAFAATATAFEHLEKDYLDPGTRGEWDRWKAADPHVTGPFLRWMEQRR